MTRRWKDVRRVVPTGQATGQVIGSGPLPDPELERFRRALEVFAEVDCQGDQPEGLWCVGCIATNVLSGSTIDAELGKGGAHLERSRSIAEVYRDAAADLRRHAQRLASASEPDAARLECLAGIFDRSAELAEKGSEER